MRLLLIEDDAALELSLRRVLERKSVTVLGCADRHETLAQWQRVQPDVVLLDLSLPGLDGLEVLARARHLGLSAPVLILTARGTVGDRIIGLNSAADDYLAKPFDLDELEARICALYGRAVGQGAESLGQAPQWGQLRLDSSSGAFYHGHGTITLQNRERNGAVEGLTVSVTLPLSREHGASYAEQPQEVHGQSSR